jgi:O-antigen/teichoic acid export membrane protein
MVIFADLGIIDTATKEFSQSQHKKNFSAFLTLNVVLTAVVLVAMLAGSFLVTADPIIRKTTWVLSFFILTTSFFGVFYAYLRSIQKMEYEGLMKIVQAVIIFFVTVFVLLYFKSALGFAYGYLLANVIFLVLFLPTF